MSIQSHQYARRLTACRWLQCCWRSTCVRSGVGGGSHGPVLEDSLSGSPYLRWAWPASSEQSPDTHRAHRKGLDQLKGQSAVMGWELFYLHFSRKHICYFTMFMGELRFQVVVFFFLMKILKKYAYIKGLRYCVII